MTVETICCWAYLRSGNDDIAGDRNGYIYSLDLRSAEPVAENSSEESSKCAQWEGAYVKPGSCLDEMSLGLAPIVVDTLIEAVSTIREEGTTIVIVEQDVGAALQLADRGYVLEHGRIVLEGPAESLQANEHVREAYLGL